MGLKVSAWYSYDAGYRFSTLWNSKQNKVWSLNRTSDGFLPKRSNILNGSILLVKKRWSYFLRGECTLCHVIQMNEIIFHLPIFCGSHVFWNDSFSNRSDSYDPKNVSRNKLPSYNTNYSIMTRTIVHTNDLNKIEILSNAENYTTSSYGSVWYLYQIKFKYPYWT